ncbi:putative indole-3-acetic acid-amido synthetase GH3.1 [Hypsibius exemplaris]|uniref:Indole-3-acetic acid-amido synthetase GH3.1 n=1 Tax=Hypsibius exemplaris TaxID=2072580 RepID=A0A1W0X014_HYPEX|nr:putative indole-3-acetic acid-amido synthetase GH3.1 [Hypsibius exemplaris]
MKTKLIFGSLSAAFVLLASSSHPALCIVTYLIGFSAAVVLTILLRVAIFKEPTFTFSVGLFHYCLNKAIQIAGRYHAWRQRRDINRLKIVQNGVLLRILKLNGKTEYGLKYKLSHVKTREDFVKAHPVTKYAHYANLVQRMTEGATNVLTKEEVLYYGATSGTTGKPSIVPQVKTMFWTQGQYVFMCLRHALNLLPSRLRYGRTMNLLYNPTRLLTKTPSGVYLGPVSAFQRLSYSIWRRDVYTTPPMGFEIADSTAAQYVHTLFGLRHRDLARIDALFASLVYFMFRTMEQNWREMVHDIREGTLNRELKIPVEIRTELEKRLNPMPARADELEKEFSQGFDNIGVRIWPKLTLINSIASGSFQQYSAILREKYTKAVKIYTPWYASTEGILGYNEWPEKDGDDVGFLLAVKSVFFEFMPLENSDDTEPATVFAEQVEKGKEYELILTNFGGLYRYRIGDVVRVVDFHGQFPVIQYVHRSSQQLNIRGEKTSEDVLLAAVAHLNNLFSAQHHFSRIIDFTSCESVLLNLKITPAGQGMTPFYVLFLELQGLIEEDREKLETQLGAELDRFLMKSQCKRYGYKYQRDKEGLAPARVLLVVPGSFQRLREFMINTSSTSPSQLKIPRVLFKQPLVDFLRNAIVV